MGDDLNLTLELPTARGPVRHPVDLAQSDHAVAWGQPSTALNRTSNSSAPGPLRGSPLGGRRDAAPRRLPRQRYCFAYPAIPETCRPPNNRSSVTVAVSGVGAVGVGANIVAAPLVSRPAGGRVPGAAAHGGHAAPVREKVRLLAPRRGGSAPIRRW